jgi:hypothetical protein
MKFKLIYCLFFLLAVSAHSQEEPKPASLNIEGQIAVTTNGKAAFINVGGPAIKFSFKHFAFAVNFMPSMRVEEHNKTITFTPLLGTGLQFYFLKHKRFIISLPCYYYAAKNTWVGTAGIGYVLTKPKK